MMTMMMMMMMTNKLREIQSINHQTFRLDAPINLSSVPCCSSESARKLSERMDLNEFHVNECLAFFSFLYSILMVPLGVSL